MANNANSINNNVRDNLMEMEFESISSEEKSVKPKKQSHPNAWIYMALITGLIFGLGNTVFSYSLT